MNDAQLLAIGTKHKPIKFINENLGWAVFFYK